MRKSYLVMLFALSFAPFTAHSGTQPIDEAALLKELVSVSSGTGSITGVNEVQEKASRILKSLGFAVEFRENPLNTATVSKSGKQVVATLKGNDPRYITLIAHADTVFEKLNPYSVSSDGKIAKGSGVSDDKGGIVVGLSALTSFLTPSPPNFSIRFVISPSEETGSAGFEAGLKSFSQDSVLILGLEPARETGAVVRSRKGIRWYEIKVTGKEAHAGVNHEQGINACHELSIKLDKLQRLTNYKLGNTVSIGHMEGGKDKFNIVCGQATAKLDVRFTDPKRAEVLFRAIEKILTTPTVESFATHEKAKTTYEISVNDPPFALTQGAKPLLARYLAILKSVEGKEFQAEDTGGSADVNMMIGNNVPIIDGLGPIGGGYHTSDEFVELPTLKTRAETLAKFLSFVMESLK